VGANVGLFSFAAAGLAGPSGRVLAIEPDPWLVSLLRRSVRANTKRTARVDVLPIAISDSLDVKQFHIARRSRSANYLDGYGLTDTGGSREMLLVPTATLDWVLERFPAPTVLKIDVEGAEAEVLKGAERLLSEAQPCVLCEVGEQNSDAVTEYLRAYGYLLFDADLAKAERRPLARACWNTLALPRDACPDYPTLAMRGSHER
jgi:FkbM family methyltransferase